MSGDVYEKLEALRDSVTFRKPGAEDFVDVRALALAGHALAIARARFRFAAADTDADVDQASVEFDKAVDAMFADVLAMLGFE